MSRFGDDASEMSPTRLDDDTVERILAGENVEASLGQLAAFARVVRSLGEEPVPPASPSLEALLMGDAARGRARGRKRGVLTKGLSIAAAKIAALGLTAKIGLGTAVAAASVAGAGAAGVLPDQANDQVRRAIEAVTPVDFDDPSSGADADHDNFGDRVSNDATGESDGENGVDGRQISQEAPGADHRPSDPSQTGQDRAGDTPAADALPDDPGAPAAGGSQVTPPSTSPSATATVPSTVPDQRSDDQG